MGEQPAIRAEGLHKRFGAVPALAGADLQVPAGGVVACELAWRFMRRVRRIRMKRDGGARQGRVWLS